MAQKIGSLYASLDLESANFLNGLKNATRATDRAATSIDKAMLKASTAVKGFVAVWAANNVIQGAQKLMELADAGKKLEGQLRLATDGWGSYAQAEKDVQRISAQTRSDLNNTGVLYAKNSRGVKELGGNQMQAALMTENFNKALKVGNANTNEAASATLAWGQAMNSGKMEGEDYNSILDASPPLIEALARSLNQPIGAMKKLVEDGKITGQVMMDALTKPEYTKKLIEDFEKVPRTWEESVTLMENQAQTLVTAFDRGSGLSNAIVDLFQSGVDGATDMGNAAEDKGIEMRAEFMATAQTIRDGFEALDDTFEPLRTAAAALFGDIRSEALSTRDYVASLFKTIDQLRNAPADFSMMLHDKIQKETGVNMPKGWFVGENHQRSDIAGTWTRNYDREVNTRQGDKANRQFADRFPNLVYKPKPGGNMMDWWNGTGAYAPKPKPKPRTPADDKKGGRKRGGSRGPSAEQLARKAEREATNQRRDALAYENELGRADSDLISARAQLTVVAKERYDAERKQLNLEFAERARNLKEEGPEGSKRYSKEQVDKLAGLDAELKTAKADEITRREQQEQADERQKLSAASLQDAIDLASSEGDLARTAKDRRAAQLRILDLSFRQEKLALEAIVASSASTDAEKQIAAARLKILDKLKAGETRQIERSTMSPGQAWLDSIPKTAGEINENMEQIAVDGLDSLKGGLLDAIKGVGSLGDAFGAMTDKVIDGLLDIALQQMLIKPLGSLLFGGGDGGGGGLFGSLVGGLTKLVGGSAVKPLGGKANGGMGNRGRWLVGEHGPEEIEVGGPFNVVPNSKLNGVRGNGGSSVNITFGSIVSNDPEAVKAMAYQAIVEATPMLTKQASDYTLGKLQRPRM